MGPIKTRIPKPKRKSNPALFKIKTSCPYTTPTKTQPSNNNHLKPTKTAPIVIQIKWVKTHHRHNTLEMQHYRVQITMLLINKTLKNNWITNLLLDSRRTTSWRAKITSNGKISWIKTPVSKSIRRVSAATKLWF